jgi:hypothetical protein
VLDTVEVWNRKAIRGGQVIDRWIDRNLHLYCDREAGTTEMAYQAEEHECRDTEMGTMRCSCMYALYVWDTSL